MTDCDFSVYPVECLFGELKLEAIFFLSSTGLLIIMSAHWVGCIFYLIASTWLAGFKKVVPLYRPAEHDLWTEYMFCLYKAFNRLTALGYDGKARMYVRTDLRIILYVRTCLRCACLYVRTDLKEVVLNLS